MKAAREFRAQVEADLATGTAVDPRDGRMTLRAWARAWHAARLHLRPSTQAKNRALAGRYLAPFGDLALGELTTADIQSWVATLPVKPATVHEVYSELRKCLDAAVQARRIRVNPCIGVHLPRKQREEMRTLSPEEVAKLADAIDPHFRPLVYFLAYSGLRIGEATALTPVDIDLRGGMVTVNRTSTEVNGVLTIQPTKTRAGVRSVPVPLKVLFMLDLSRATVFTGKAGGPLRVNAFRRRFWLPATLATGLNVRIHDLRHTAVSHWIRKGANLLELKNWAGHTSSNFTIDRYGHLMETRNDALMAALEADIV